ncbi:lysophospholipid acyltransferase family protein [Histophilus somni]|uniref:lysophospholipid acyltransferase family protein n=1 Tax=Histophilus somni TaxID=731 RepID=UPI0000397567|nr:lysophospholipid acyltransferase family protein [Histophilus somni]ACA31793.1 phospholipid/glycerol acyltransferase [Histophilus somni 2336]QQF86022.1 1-acyl-sn-glycerol-3-phosphate acyltransferase [Histophilus somni]QQJ90172.1 1-acyl-sn-glycerol-3-phosphate acyltransferase [Histophilus somni]
MEEKLDWLRRFLGTLFGFILFGFVGVLFKIILYPYAKQYPKADLATQLKGRKIVSRTWAFFVRYLIWAGILEVRYHGFERLGRKGQLVLANHPSLLDVVLIFSQVPEFNCIVKQDLLKNPAMSSPIKACGFVPNTESEELLEMSHRILQEQSLLLFPEGTRTGWDGVVKLHRGAVSIGLRSAKVITPVVIKMTPLNFKKGQPWYKIPKTKIAYELTVGEDIDPQKWSAEKPLPIASRRLNQYLEDYFNSQTKD